jgi:putative endonuclease
MPHSSTQFCSVAAEGGPDGIVLIQSRRGTMDSRKVWFSTKEIDTDMNGLTFWERIRSLWGGKVEVRHLRHGRIGEQAARRHLQRNGLKFLTANFKSRRGEIDLIFRDADCLVFVEVKTRSSEAWTRPAAAVNARKRKLISQTAFDYLRLLKEPRVKLRFDIVEVLLDEGCVDQVRHLPNAFNVTEPYRF